MTDEQLFELAEGMFGIPRCTYCDTLVVDDAVIRNGFLWHRDCLEDE